MDGVFMLKFVKYLFISILVVCFASVGSLIADKCKLQNELVRFHVVANSDSEHDQEVKRCVRDALLDFIRENTDELSEKEAVLNYLRGHSLDMQKVAEDTLERLGETQQVSVNVTRETFGARQYDTFTLPSGVYDSLRVEIGEAQGKNWWCVVFPALCAPNTVETFKDTAVSCGLGEDLTETLSNQNGYEIRFFFLDCLGKLENLFFFQ